MPETDTLHGPVDSDALQSLQQTYDTRTILHAVDQLDGIRARCGPDGLRDDLLRLHGVAHTVINGASLSYSTAGPTLVEQVDAVLWELDDWILALTHMRKALEPLAQLRADSES
ncbi:transposase [Ralstonia solanacearum]|uniref:Tn3 family transposase post-transcriptional regulator TnpC n=1 Tax=Ralstonia solanacearum TaxID=305 RepID=UPI0005ABBC30|nr:Tn3 family transposase post-transcriptional regulator TnpC [Ralstonia solanacearum]MDC6176390.1 Tn3 family transposase post-transcriptional regulator TnpC [Ralstonia solanacearum]MDC6209393.1 Tn3 family transposase post-transcriptional regulator TnpC [Ralstonia solanacearum]MDC6237519.1 Tn3 family transposase post-transcriptional regulator TnpC [Ralstonia solanacearum]MDD7799799.1 Tn3 family transposase post-transcriptional regulator TnpC [Ralstonia solanacearum]TYZ55588.1 transposase [Rals